MSNELNLPRWLKPVNKVVTFLYRWGIAFGPLYVLSIPGRKSGKIYSTPVSPMRVDGKRYICTVGDTGWVKNARVAGWGTLARGRKQEKVALVELPVEERAPILRQFPVQLPAGVAFFKMTLGISGDPDSFAAAAPQCPVFRIAPPG